jgi:hypothetical protein
MDVCRPALRGRPFRDGGVTTSPARRRTAATAVVFALGLSGAGLANGCGTGAVNVDGCRQIEEARCRQGPACGIPLEPPYFTSETDVDACIRFYDDACLHGLAASDPGAAAVNACVAAIQSDTAKKDGCGIVKSPQTAVACAWLVPPASTVPDAADAPVTESDASADVASQ